MLDTIFYELLNEGYIYSVDEDGQTMSYGEYFAVDEYFQNAIKERVEECSDFEEAANFIKDEVQGCGDDVRLFTNLDEFADFDFYIDEYDRTVEAWNVPDMLKEKLEDYIYYHDYELVA